MNIYNQRQLSPICGLITSGQTVDCAAIPSRGANSTVWMFNYDHKGAFTLSGGVVSALALTSTNLAYAFEGLRNSTRPKATYKKSKYDGFYEQELQMIGTKVAGADFVKYQTLAKSKVIVISEMNYSGTAGETSYKIFGWYSGLFISDLVFDPYDPDSNIKFTLKSDEESPEPTLPLALFNTDKATSLAIITDLLS